MLQTMYVFCFLLILSHWRALCAPNLAVDGNNGDDLAFKFKSIVVQGNINQPYSILVNNTVEYLFVFSDAKTVTDAQPARITVECEDATRKFPVLVVLRQAKGVLSWQIPLMVSTHEDKLLPFSRTSRTLCPNHNYRNLNPHLMMTDIVPPRGPLGLSKSVENLEPEVHNVYISIFSESVQNLNVSLVVNIEEHFIVKLNDERSIVVTPSEPRYFEFHWPEGQQPVHSVLLSVDSMDEFCMTVSIQNITCPVFDLEHTVQFEGFWQTVKRKGGITLTKTSFPSGFYIVFVVKGDDFDCSTEKSGKNVNETERSKQVSFSLQPSIGYEEYWISLLGTLLLFSSFYIAAFIVSLVYLIRRHSETDILSDETLDYTSDVENSCASTSDVFGNAQTPVSDISMLPGSDDSSLDETDIDTLADANLDKDVIRSKRVLYVCDLARKNPQVLRKKSLLYLWNLCTVATFYALPVVQLVISYQKVLQETGNQDLCYYNFLCAHPLGFISDFNHVFSNVGYVWLGLLFIIMVYRRDRMHCRAVAQSERYDRVFGIPQHYGLFYAMGAALMMEGFLSGCYHVCPNHSNFQFDTSFMYVISMLCMLKIYHTRHPDINASAYATFGMLALVILVGMTGIISGTTSFWAGFTVLHISICIWLSGQIYYMGRLRFGLGKIRQACHIFTHEFLPHPCSYLWPKYPSRMVLLILGNMCNWALAAVVWIFHLDSFGSYLLAIFMANLVLYTTFYIVMKLLNGERILLQPALYIILASACWSAALYFFFRKSISWQLSPAESRKFNQPCEILRFYDKHDIWHFLSAASMFFSFMVLLTLDDDLVHVPRTKIPVF